MRRLLLSLALLFAALGAQPAPPEKPYGRRAEVREFIREMVGRHGFVEKELAYLFARARREPAI
ncbi:MAG: lytic murein transglycosylase B, partial [Pseudomonadota bacterium]